MPSPDVVFWAAAGATALRFSCERGGVLPARVIPVRKVYFVSNAVAMVRLPERTPLPVRSVEVSVDSESWSWGFAANLAASALAAIEPTAAGPVEVELTINDVVWVLLVEAYTLHREFGRESLTIRGRSQAAYLAAPYAPARSWTPATFYTARQLADAELARDGVPTGFTLHWTLPDWLVPAGAWTYQALTPVEALGRIVGAVGGTLLPHPSAKALTAGPRYPTAPWEWVDTTPAVSLPLDAVSTLDLRWQEKPAYNAVYVAGERQGIIGRVLRAGTAGDRVAPLVVDGLITHADAARERGRAILADTAKQALVTLELPLFPETGRLDPGAAARRRRRRRQLARAGPRDTYRRGLARQPDRAPDRRSRTPLPVGVADAECVAAVRATAAGSAVATRHRERGTRRWRGDGAIARRRTAAGDRVRHRR